MKMWIHDNQRKAWAIWSISKNWSRAALLALLPLPMVASANCTSLGCFGVYVQQLTPTRDNGIYVQTSGAEAAICGQYFHIAAGAPKEIFATLLAAHLGNKLVSITIQENVSPCSILYVELNRQ